MKKLLMALMLVTAVASQAQTWVFQSFDSSVKDGWWDMVNLYANNGDAEKKWDVTDYTADKKEGVASLKLDYALGAADSWGGYLVRTSIKPFPNNLTWDLSTGTKLTFWYKVLVPTVMSTAGGMNMEVKLCDTQDGQENRVYRSVAVDLTDASGQWKQMTVDFTMGDDASVAWKYQAGPVEGRDMQWDKVNGMELTVFYAPPGGGTGTNTPTAKGTVLLDGFAIEGDKYAPPLFNFDNSASKWGQDPMDWAGADGKGAVKLTDEATDKVEGAGSLKFEYTCNASQDWGGFVAFDMAVTPPDKFVERTALILWLKNTKAIVSTKPERAMLRFFIMEKSNGTDTEEWIIKVPIDLSKVSDWTRYVLPLKTKALPNGDQDPPTDGFAPKSNNGDKTFNHDKIVKVRLEILAAGAGPLAGPKGEKLTGTLLFDICQGSGFQIYDITKPGAPKNFAGIKGSYSNLVSWGDVDNEGTEKYDIYASKTAITSLTAAGVEKIATGIARQVQVFEHTLKTPKIDKDVTWYYAIQAIDKNKNEGAIATAGPITNKAKGVPTIALKTINFKADGNLDEWAGVTPFEIYPSKGGHIMTSWKVDNDADNSADCYIAIDKDYLYVAYNVNDDIIVADVANYYTTGYNWALDAVDLEIGFYNQKSPHTSYKTGAEPDYHIRFNKLRARNDSAGKDSLLLPGDNYYWQEKFPSGYVVEAKIKLTELASFKGQKDVIYVKEGYKIPINFVIMDNDGGTNAALDANREGQMSYSFADNNDGYYNPTLWTYTWLGDTDVIATDVEKDEMPVTYSLSQNYPNPFNPTTQIKYSILNAGNVSLKIFDVLGREVADLVNQNQDAGHYTVNFNASSLSSGIYFYRIESGSFTSVKKMMLVK